MNTRKLMGVLGAVAVFGVGAAAYQVMGNEAAAASGTASKSAAKPELQDVRIEDKSAQLEARAKITREEAIAIVMAAYPGASINEVELEDEDGAFVYSFDFTLAGQAGKLEVTVDATSGALGKLEHDADDEDDEHEDDEHDDDGK